MKGKRNNGDMEAYQPLSDAIRNTITDAGASLQAGVANGPQLSRDSSGTKELRNLQDLSNVKVKVN